MDIPRFSRDIKKSWQNKFAAMLAFYEKQCPLLLRSDLSSSRVYTFVLLHNSNTFYTRIPDIQIHPAAIFYINAERVILH
jgi:hypothetical protein